MTTSPGRADEPTVGADREFGETWVYESIVSALPGADLAGPAAIALQIFVFEVALLVVGAAYGLWNAVLPGTAAVVVAAVGSFLMLKLGDTNRTLRVHGRYYRLLFGSSIEVVLAVLAFVALVTHLFVYDPAFVGRWPVADALPFPVAQAEIPLVTTLFGERPPVVAVYLALLLLWDLCYRIGASWWIAVVSLYRELRLPRAASAGAAFRRLDVLNVGFALVQVALLPFITDRPVLLIAVGGHIVAVTAVSAAAVALSYARERA